MLAFDAQVSVARVPGSKDNRIAGAHIGPLFIYVSQELGPYADRLWQGPSLPLRLLGRPGFITVIVFIDKQENNRGNRRNQGRRGCDSDI